MAEQSPTNTIELTKPQLIITKEVIDSLKPTLILENLDNNINDYTLVQKGFIRSNKKRLGKYKGAVINFIGYNTSNNYEDNNQNTEVFEIELTFHYRNPGAENTSTTIKYPITLNSDDDYEKYRNAFQEKIKKGISNPVSYTLNEFKLVEYTVVNNKEDKIMETPQSDAKGGKRRTKKASKRSTKKRVQKRVRRTRR